MKQIIILSIALLAGFLTAEAQDINSLHRKQAQQQDWWEPDTVQCFNDMGIFRYIYEYHYNSKELLAVCIEQLHGENYTQTTYTYDSHHILLSKLIQEWDDNSWVNSKLYTYTYDYSNNNLLTGLYQNWVSNSWVNVSLDTYTYDPNNNLLTGLYQSWHNNLWVDIYLNSYTYDSDNKKQTRLYQNWENIPGLDSTRFTYTYDFNNNMQTELWQEWKNNSWENYALSTYTYDSNNNLLTDTEQGWNWNTNSWVNSTQYRMTYDENDNGISIEWWIWKEDSWQPSHYGAGLSYGNLYLYYNNMQNIFEDRAGMGGDKMTASYVKVSGNNTGVKDVKSALPVQIYSAGKTIYVSNRTGKAAVATVYGIDGVKVAEQTMLSQAATLEMPVSGFYLVSVRAGNEKPVTAKVRIR